MHAFCTYCSAQKSKDPGDIPAIHRYQSHRIARVYRAAQELRQAFFILSGEYGLLSPDHPIPWYDHLLKLEEVALLANRIAEQIAHLRIDGFTFFTQSLERDPSVAPYCQALLKACEQVSVPLSIVEVNLDD